MGREDQADTAPHESLQPAAHLSGTLSGDPLNLTGAAGASVEETSPNIEQLAAFARCLEPAPLCKPRLGRGPAAGPSSQGGNAHAGPITWRRWRDLDRDRRARVLRSPRAFAETGVARRLPSDKSWASFPRVSTDRGSAGGFDGDG